MGGLITAENLPDEMEDEDKMGANSILFERDSPSLIPLSKLLVRLCTEEAEEAAERKGGRRGGESSSWTRSLKDFEVERERLPLGEEGELLDLKG